MELPKPKGDLTYKIGDVTFYYRSMMTARDKAQLDLVGSMQRGKWTWGGSAYVEKIIELFVTKWEGVTEDGKPVPYDFGLFMERFPSGHGGSIDVLVELSSEIGTKLGLFANTDAQIKKND